MAQKRRGRRPLPKAQRKVSTTIFLKRDMQRALQSLAARLDRSMGDLLREGASVMLADEMRDLRKKIDRRLRQK